MNNEELKPENVEDNKESLLLGKIRRLEEENRKLEEQNRKLQENVAELNVDLMHDSRTGLKAKSYLEERLEDIISSFKNPENKERKEGFKNLSLLFCDIDNFKKINDTLGHLVGNEVLKKVSEIINENVRAVDIVCRWGGDEIVVALLGANEEEAAIIAEKIRLATEEGMKDMGVTMSIGAVSYEEGLNMKSITDRADKAMYWAKRMGKNKVKTYSGVLSASKKEK